MPYNSFNNQSQNGIFHPLHPKNLWRKPSTGNNRITRGQTREMISTCMNRTAFPSIPPLAVTNMHNNNANKNRNFFSRFRSIEEFKLYRRALQFQKKSIYGCTERIIEEKTVDSNIGFVMIKKDDIIKFKTEISIAVSIYFTIFYFLSTHPQHSVT